MSYAIVHVSDGDKHFATAIQEYYKRMKGVVEVCVKPEKHGNAKQIQTKETQKVLEILQKKYADWTKVLLDIDGESLTTEQVVRFTHKHHNILFCIGGPYGFDQALIRPHIDAVRSWGHITMPHGLAKLVTLEQIYRAHAISIGKKYHY